MTTRPDPTAESLMLAACAGAAPGRLDAAGAGALIAHVLRHAHELALMNSPDEARAILHVARSFADELARTNPQFDRLGFIKDATGLG